MFAVHPWPVTTQHGEVRDGWRPLLFQRFVGGLFGEIAETRELLLVFLELLFRFFFLGELQPLFGDRHQRFTVVLFQMLEYVR